AKMLERKIKIVPKHIMIVADKELTQNFDQFLRFLDWSKKFGINEITICFPSDCINVNKFKDTNFFVKVIRNGEVFEFGKKGDFILNLILGYRGKDEIVDAVKKIASLVECRKLDIEEVDESLIEKFLIIKSSPDLIIRAGKEIPEFLTWQSIYSELYFIDIEWKSFRYIDFLRCLRDFQRRERRYGR
ncbi:MAG: undecaprenyl diphosphate synthase family protein, partial [Archaeoglobaceae archaeon]|nr:undecaprenyl diphosphate synthase family protein [Archaeoglobaceae archaeon]